MIFFKQLDVPIFQYILEEIFFSGTPLLEAVGMHEPFVVELREVIKNAVARSIIPMKVYAHQYQEYVEVMNLDVSNYVRYVSLAVSIRVVLAFATTVIVQYQSNCKRLFRLIITLVK